MQSIQRQLNCASTFMNCVWIHAAFKVQFEIFHLILSALTSGSSSSSSSSSLLSSSSLSFCKSSSSSTSRYFSISLWNMMNKIKGKKRTEEKKRKEKKKGRNSWAPQPQDLGEDKRDRSIIRPILNSKFKWVQMSFFMIIDVKTKIFWFSTVLNSNHMGCGKQNNHRCTSSH